MESAEAILENENNSNVESESYIRQQQQLSLQNEAVAADQDGLIGQSVSMADGGSLGLNDPLEDPAVARHSHEETEKGSFAAEAREENEMGESDRQLSESINVAHDNESSRLSEEDSTMKDDGENEMRSDDTTSNNQTEDALTNDEDVNVDEAKDVAMRDGESELTNDKDVGTSENVMGDDEKAEDLDAGEENIEGDIEEKRSSSLLQHHTDQDSNSQLSDLQQDSTGECGTLMQFSPLGDNDLMESSISTKVDGVQSDSPELAADSHSDISEKVEHCPSDSPENDNVDSSISTQVDRVQSNSPEHAADSHSDIPEKVEHCPSDRPENDNVDSSIPTQVDRVQSDSPEHAADSHSDIPEKVGHCPSDSPENDNVVNDSSDIPLQLEENHGNVEIMSNSGDSLLTNQKSSNDDMFGSNDKKETELSDELGKDTIVSEKGDCETCDEPETDNIEIDEKNEPETDNIEIDEKGEKVDENIENTAEEEAESNSDEQNGVIPEIMPMSQEEENHLLNDEVDEGNKISSDEKVANQDIERDSNEHESHNVISQDEIEVESQIPPENSSIEVTGDQVVQSSNEDESEMVTESSPVTREEKVDKESNENKLDTAERVIESDMELGENASEKSHMPQGEPGVAEDDQIVLPSMSSAAQKEENVSTGVDEVDDMDTSTQDVRKEHEAGSEANTDYDLKEMEVDEPSENMEIESEIIDNVEKISDSSERVEKSNDSAENTKQSPEVVENSVLPEEDMSEQSSLSYEDIELSSKTSHNEESSEKATDVESNVESSIDVSKQVTDSKVQDSKSAEGKSNLESAQQSVTSVSAEETILEKKGANNAEMIDGNDASNMKKDTEVNDVMPVSTVKKEIAEIHQSKSSTEASLPISSKELKKEIINDDDEIVILDDDDDPVTVKEEAVEDKGRDAKSGILISDVSGQEDKAHSDAFGTSKDSDDKSEKSGKSKTQKCIVCHKVTKCKFNIVRGGDTKQLCDDICFKKFRKSPTKFLAKPTLEEQPQSTLPTVQPPGMMVVNLGDQPAQPATSAANTPALVSLLTIAASQQQQQQQAKQQAQQQDVQPQNQQPDYKTCTVCQVINIQAPQSFCNWKGFDFCGEICLGKFQSTLRPNCSNCLAFIPNEMRASYCTKIGNTMHPFCKQMCVADFIRRLKTCACCKQDLTKTKSATVIARVGADNKPKEFCSENCVKKFQDQVEDVEIVHVEPGQGSTISACSVCKSQANAILHAVRFHSKTFKLCSDICLSAFQYTNKINLNTCSTCGNICTPAQSQPYFIQFEGETKRFCSDRCISTFRLDNRKLASCSWCSARKVNFDMIERQDENNKYQLFCSLNCLSLFRVNLQAKSNQAVECDRCRKIVPAQYHLTMSDASVRNFCSYACVMGFQSQFTARISPPLPPPSGTTTSTAQTSVPQNKIVKISDGLKIAMPVPQKTPVTSAATPQATPAVHPHGTRNRGRRASKGTPKTPQPTALTHASTSPSASIPVISSVMSLAPGDARQETVTGEQLQEKAVQTLLKNLEKKGALVSGDGKQRVVVEMPIPKMMKNKAVQCKPTTQTKATACRPHSQTKECQTDENMGKPVLIPIPVPIYIPMPTVMYQAPAPVPVPFPIPIPVPIFIPTTRKSANGIIRTIKEIQERMPADPLEAEILMMAQAVATDGGVAGDDDSDSELEGDTGFEPPADDDDLPKMDAPVPEKEERRAEDMIQMALRMAEEMTGPMEDLETSVQPVAVNSISSQVAKPEQSIVANPTYQMQEEDPDYMPVKAGRGRGSKRASRGRPPLNNRNKRQRISTEREMQPEEQVPPAPLRIQTVVEPSPDTNYRLKFTYGVNAWKHWVVTKNKELEVASKTNPRVRLLPMDVLKCTMDELHFSLCLFIKEVRKPNGEPYSPDSIYYLCLGIQQYLYENGRIDNIFTDLYFQRFTDSLHDVLKALQPKVNSQGQMLCRIEEEHLWESKQLGAHSPYVLLNTLIYFHTKHFILKTAADHMSLSFAQILKHWKKGVPLKGNAVVPKNASLRFYCLANNKKQDSASRKKEGGVPVYEVTENFDNPLRCPVKLYEFFLSKCPESIKNRNDIFYPVPERSCVPDSPVWYSTQSIEHHTMDKMLTRILLVREIQESHLHAQPTYIKM